MLSWAAGQPDTNFPKKGVPSSPIVVESLKIKAPRSFETSECVNPATQFPDNQMEISRQGNNNLYHCVLYIAQHDDSVTTHVCLQQIKVIRSFDAR